MNFTCICLGTYNIIAATKKLIFLKKVKNIANYQRFFTSVELSDVMGLLIITNVFSLFWEKYWSFFVAAIKLYVPKHIQVEFMLILSNLDELSVSCRWFSSCQWLVGPAMCTKSIKHHRLLLLDSGLCIAKPWMLCICYCTNSIKVQQLGYLFTACWWNLEDLGCKNASGVRVKDGCITHVFVNNESVQTLCFVSRQCFEGDIRASRCPNPSQGVPTRRPNHQHHGAMGRRVPGKQCYSHSRGGGRHSEWHLQQGEVPGVICGWHHRGWKSKSTFCCISVNAKLCAQQMWYSLNTLISSPACCLQW